jgi:outer membrane receptor protein involved in Fe transport
MTSRFRAGDLGGNMSQAQPGRTCRAGSDEHRSFGRRGQRPRARLFLAAGVAAGLALPLPVLAQDEDIGEIVVTGLKRRDAVLKEIPVAIEAVTAEDLQRKGITDIARLAEQSASIKFDQGSSRSDTRLSIRGLSPTRGRQNAAILVDGIDISSEAVSNSGGSILLNQRLLSPQSIEIVKGPQSALYGRSAFNGAINFITKDPPEEWSGQTGVDANAEDQYTVTGEFGGPIFGEALGIFVNGAWWDEDGFYDNSITGENIGQDEGYGFSVKTRSEFGDGFSIELRGSYEHYEQGQSPEAYLGFNTVRIQPEGAFAPNTDPDIPPGPPGDPVPKALFCLNDNLNAITPNSPIEQQLQNQALIDRYIRQSLDPNNPAIGDGPHCQRRVVGFAGEVPDSDQLKAQLATNPFTPGLDYPGVDGDTIRLTAVLDWELEKGGFTWSLGYTHDDNNEQIDFSRFAIRNPDNPYLDDNVNIFQSNNDKFTRQFTQELRYATKFDGPVNMTIGANYWEEDVSNKSRSLTMQAGASYCFYSVDTLDTAPGTNPFNPGCPGYTELPVQQIVGKPVRDADGNLIAGIEFADPNETAVWNGIEQYTRDSPVDRNTDHYSIYGLLDIEFTENTTLTLEGRWNHEELEVLGPVFWNTLATGGPGSWSICGVPGRPCQFGDYDPPLTGLDYLRRAPGTVTGGFGADPGGPFWNLNNFMDTFDVFQGVFRTGVPGVIGTKNANLFQVFDPIVSPNGVLNPQCVNDPNLLAYEAAVDAAIAAAEPGQAEDPRFDLFNPFCQGKLERTDDWFSPKITLSHNVTEDALVYGSWAHSEKPGGYALFTVGASGLRADLSEYRPEKMDTWELGIKTTTLDGALYLEGALYFNDYTDKQVIVQGLGPDGRSVSKIDNAPAEVLGAEFTAQWRPETTFLGGNWTIAGSYLYTDGEYKDYVDIATSENNIALAGNCDPATLEEFIIVQDPLTGQGTAEVISRAACAISFDGNKLERAPEHSLVGTVNYTVPIGDTLEGMVELGGQWKSKQYVEYTNESWIDSYQNFDLRAGVRGERWEVIGYVENLLDDDAVRSASSQPGLGCCFMLGVAVDLSGELSSIGSTAEVPNARAAFLTPPRVFGLRANYRFGGQQ